MSYRRRKKKGNFVQVHRLGDNIPEHRVGTGPYRSISMITPYHRHRTHPSSENSYVPTSSHLPPFKVDPSFGTQITFPVVHPSVLFLFVSTVGSQVTSVSIHDFCTVYLVETLKRHWSFLLRPIGDRSCGSPKLTRLTLKSGSTSRRRLGAYHLQVDV